MTTTDLTYLAGLLDASLLFRLRKQKQYEKGRPHPRFQSYITLTTPDLNIVNLLSLLWGDFPFKLARSGSYFIQFGEQKTPLITRELYPYLLNNKKMATAVLDIADLRGSIDFGQPQLVDWFEYRDKLNKIYESTLGQQKLDSNIEIPNWPLETKLNYLGGVIDRRLNLGICPFDKPKGGKFYTGYAKWMRISGTQVFLSVIQSMLNDVGIDVKLLRLAQTNSFYLDISDDCFSKFFNLMEPYLKFKKAEIKRFCFFTKLRGTSQEYGEALKIFREFVPIIHQFKTCTQCNRVFSTEDFYNNKKMKDGLTIHCYHCILKRSHAWLGEKSGQITHKDTYKELAQSRIKAFYKENPWSRARKNAIARVRRRLQYLDIPKRHSVNELLGCNAKIFKKHIESKFQDNMSWDNYPLWEIDHVMPISLFDLRNDFELKSATHYTNLAPIWAEDNQKKSNSLIL